MKSDRRKNLTRPSSGERSPSPCPPFLPSSDRALISIRRVAEGFSPGSAKVRRIRLIRRDSSSRHRPLSNDEVTPYRRRDGGGVDGGVSHRRKREVGGGGGGGGSGGGGGGVGAGARDAGECERDGKKREVNQEGWTGRQRGARGTAQKGERGRIGGEERDGRWWGRQRAGHGRGGGEEKSWGSMDATPRGTTLSRILRSKPAAA